MTLAAPRVAHVAMGEITTSLNRHGALGILGLGSTVGVVIYDRLSGAGGIAHVVLPTATDGDGSQTPGRYADTAVPALVAKLVEGGLAKARLVAKIAGGSQMFGGGSGGSGVFQVGARNVGATVLALKKAGVPLLGSDTGGTRGRTLHYFPDRGKIVIKIIGESEREL